MSQNEVFIERRDDGPYAVERPNCKRASGLFDTQKEAEEFAKNLSDEPTVHIARVRNIGPGPDKWRS